MRLKRNEKKNWLKLFSLSWNCVIKRLFCQLFCSFSILHCHQLQCCYFCPGSVVVRSLPDWLFAMLLAVWCGSVTSICPSDPPTQSCTNIQLHSIAPPFGGKFLWQPSPEACRIKKLDCVDTSCVDPKVALYKLSSIAKPFNASVSFWNENCGWKFIPAFAIDWLALNHLFSQVSRAVAVRPRWMVVCWISSHGLSYFDFWHGFRKASLIDLQLSFVLWYYITD